MSRRLILVGVGVLTAVALAAWSRPGSAPWLINESASLPRGLYALSAEPPALGSIVAVTPPASARTYLAGLGAPRDARLLKYVAALPGEAVCHDGRRMRWGRGEADALIRDRRGRALPAWRGCRRLGADELLLIGQSPWSFDSRYFGPVRRHEVQGVYREVLRW